MAPRLGRARIPRGPGGESAGSTVESAVFLVDNSALQRSSKPAVREALHELNRVGTLSTCLPLMLEAGFSARSTREHEKILDVFGAWKILRPTPGLDEVAIMLQRRLFEHGKGRAAGAFDLQVAAYALASTLEGQPVVVVHYDGDYEHLRSVEPRLLTRWVVPRGSVD